MARTRITGVGALLRGTALAAALLLGAAPAVAVADPGSGPACPYRVHTPPAVDASEVPRPGQAPPPPLPVPVKPVGGDALGSCGLVTAPIPHRCPRTCRPRPGWWPTSTPAT